MDPNATLRELLEISTWARTSENAHGEAAEVAFADMAEKFAALDEWLSRGGFLPEDWAQKRDGTAKPQLQVQDWMRRAHDLND